MYKYYIINFVISDREPPPRWEENYSEQQHESAVAAHDLTFCGCGCDYVQPVQWDEAGSKHWRMEMRCPNCENCTTTIVSDEVVDYYDLEMEMGARVLAKSLHDAVAQREEDEIARLRLALDTELILPEDF